MGHLVIRKKQTQTNPIKANSKPKQTQLLQRAKMMQSVYLQPIMKNNAVMGYEKQTQNKPNLKIF